MHKGKIGKARLRAGALLARLWYHPALLGCEHLPAQGAALLVSNHVTLLDAFLVQCCTRRSIRFVISRDVYNHRWIGPLLKGSPMFPVSPAEPATRIDAALEQARTELERGHLVCLFAEGALTRNGLMRAFLPGVDRLAGAAGVPVIPVYIAGAWGHRLSYGSAIQSGRRRTFRSPITLLIGPPQPAMATHSALRRAVLELSCTSFDIQKNQTRTLARHFIRSARRHRWRRMMTDTTGRKLRFGQALTAAIALASPLRRLTSGQSMIGILLPPSVGAALANYAITLNGQVAVNLNFTVSSEALASSIQQCQLHTILTSRKFVERTGDFGLADRLLFLEDLASRIRPAAKLAAAFHSLCTPAHRLAASAGGPDDVAAILFSSGSTGLPKGIQLSHHNLISNIESFRLAMHLTPRDRMCASLPFFHSFGFTTNLWGPTFIGCSAHFHSNPLDGATITQLVREHRLTLLLATPTFLLAYLRRGTRTDFASLRAVITGAEKLHTRVADAFEQQFGIRPLEGYGATELAPVVSLNIPDVERNGLLQAGTKAGSIGHPICGVVARVHHPESGAVLDENEEGLLWIKGPNVMLGYLNNQEATREVICEGWYNTGDIARMDRDGFLYIVDRLSRYSKIGGEMVPHLAVEDKIAAALGQTGRDVVVTSVRDAHKGEQLVVCYTRAAGELEDIRRSVRQCDLPNLWKPRAANFMRVEEIPHLASGKLDLRKIRQLAEEFVSRRPTLGQRALDTLRQGL